MNKALILTNGLFTTSDAKTAHGLVRGSERFTIVGVVDSHATAGKDAGTLLDGRPRNISIFASLKEALTKTGPVDFLIVGIATVGGRLPDNMLEVLKEALNKGISIVNGLHDLLCEKPELTELAQQQNVELIDIRKPKRRADLHFWNGSIYTVKAPVIAVMGTDCAIGKRTTARLLRQACEKSGLRSEMVYTGQTGWLQGGRYGFILDSTLNDFVSGELEHAIVQCYNETGADIIFLEGQSALRNPSGPCGLEFLLSGNARHAVLVFAPGRKYFDNEPHWGEIPDVRSEISLYRMLGTSVIALAMNTEGLAENEIARMQKELEEELGIPVLLPVQEGVDKLMPVLRTLKAEFRS